MLRLSALLLAVSFSAAAQERPAFGKQRGQVLPLGALSFASVSAGGATTTSVTVDPELLVFAADHFLLGGDVAFTTTSASGSTRGSTGWGAGVHAGFSVDLGEAVSLLVVGTIGYSSQQSTVTAFSSTFTDTRNALSAGLSAPILFHVAPHFFLGFGPSGTWELTASVSSSSTPGSSDVSKGHVIALSSLIGGWF